MFFLLMENEFALNVICLRENHQPNNQAFSMGYRVNDKYSNIQQTKFLLASIK